MQRDGQASSDNGSESQATSSADRDGERPTVICFHGSGENAGSAWEEFVSLARTHYKAVLSNRGSRQTSIGDANLVLLNHLRDRHLDPPYILVAHSYGGAFAKMFLYENTKMVAGMLLVETGQEGGLPDDVEASLLERSLLGNKPLSVIRGNSLIASWEALQIEEAAADSESAKAALATRRRFLATCDAEDDRLKKAQLKLSSNSRYVHLPDCGHNVVRDRPDVVFEELRWIMSNLRPEPTSIGLSNWFTRWWREVRQR